MRVLFDISFFIYFVKMLSDYWIISKMLIKLTFPESPLKALHPLR
jgi:hypothetical protein